MTDSMSQHEQEIVTDVQEEQEKMAPVSESIRYRKRAQAAEQQLEQLSLQVEKQQEQLAGLQRALDEKTKDQELNQALTQAGVEDVEAAFLLAQMRLQTDEGREAGLKQVIADLEQERPWLFYDKRAGARQSPGPTQGVRRDAPGGKETLNRLAEQARNSGSRRDMQEYLRVRRTINS